MASRSEPAPPMRFDTSGLPPERRLPVFQEATRSLFEVWPRSSSCGFAVDAIGYRAGELEFHRVRCSPLQLRRRARHLRGSGSDVLMLERPLEGEQRVTMREGRFRLRPGHVHLRDWYRPFEAETDALTLECVKVPRHRLRAGAAVLASRPVVSWPTEEPEGRMLSSLWDRIVGELPCAYPLVAERLAEAFLGFVNGLLERTPTEPAPVTLEAMERFLQAHLHEDIGTRDLCDRFRVSRSAVYRLFEPHGGVMRYINAARLARCYADLHRSDPCSRTVGEIAASWGFCDASAFSRRFKARFGEPPSAVLRADFDAASDASLDGRWSPDAAH